MSKPAKPRNKARKITISGARTHTLKNVNCDIPHGRLTVITGPSGSGKSSLAFDTLYAEGQRRYVESMSAYARQFLERIEKPDVDLIQHVLPAIALEQKNHVKNARSTVGTATEIYDYLRLLYATIGKTRCGKCGGWVSESNPKAIAKQLAKLADGTKLLILAPVSLSLFSPEALIEQGYYRLFYDDGNGPEIREIQELKDTLKDTLGRNDTVHVLIDRLITRKTDAKGGQSQDNRFLESIRNALALGQGHLVTHTLSDGKTKAYQSDFVCEDCQTPAEKPTHQMFAFNSPLGACPSCEGFGRIIGLDLDKVIPNKALSLKEGAIHPYTTPANAEMQEDLLAEGKKNKIRLDVPFEELTAKEKAFVIDGKGEYWGVRKFFDWLETKKYKVHVRVMLAKYRGYYECPDCLGARIRPEALRVVLVAGSGGRATGSGGSDGQATGQDMSIRDLCNLPVKDIRAFFEALELPTAEAKMTERLLREINHRLNYLEEVGLDYLTLSRQSRTLSGGEAQRINLSTALGSKLTDTLYVLDEPTVGLHARDTHKLLEILKALRDNGNTLVVVEHDPDMIEGADHILDMGPGGGEEGGRIIYEGDLPGLMKTGFSVTAQYLKSGAKLSPESLSRQQKILSSKSGKHVIEIIGARGNNLKNVSVKIPKNQLVCISGVSGSGKSTLIKQTLFTGYEHLNGRSLQLDAAPCSELRGMDEFQEVIMVDQTPPGRSARSNPVTYMKAYDEIRTLFADSRKAMVLGLKPGDFSFNTPGGRCETCEGMGVITIDMQFMADVTVTCHDCKGRRFNHNVLSIDLFGKNINDILNMTVDEAMKFFKTAERIRKKLLPLQKIGLGYLKLGQSTATLSGGEAQRLKLANYLNLGTSKGNICLFLFDEPTTGLHMADIDRLVDVFRQLMESGHSVIVIEHNLDFIARADHIIDLGPEGGDGGGQIIAQGSVEEIMKEKKSYTGRFLQNKLVSV